MMTNTLTPACKDYSLRDLEKDLEEFFKSKKYMDFVIGHIMSITNGKANPNTIKNYLIKDEREKADD